MEGRLIKLMATLMIILSFGGLAWAGDSVTLAVSCTIPAIPGVNVPLITEEGNTATEIAARSKEEIKETVWDNQVAQNTQGDDRGQTLLVEENTATAIVRTVYSR